MLSVRVFLVLAAFLVAAAILGLYIAPQSNVGFADDASVLAFAALVAVGIERILELTWTLLGQSGSAAGGRSGSWPRCSTPSKRSRTRCLGHWWPRPRKL